MAIHIGTVTREAMYCQYINDATSVSPFWFKVATVCRFSAVGGQWQIIKTSVNRGLGAWNKPTHRARSTDAYPANIVQLRLSYIALRLYLKDRSHVWEYTILCDLFYVKTVHYITLRLYMVA